jgi:hypothetical protein
MVDSFDYDNKLQPITYFMKFTSTDDLLLQVKNVQKNRDSVVFVVTILPLVFLVLGILFPSLREILK